MRAITRVEAAAVRGKRSQLEESLELFGDQGRVLRDPSLDELAALGFSMRDAKRWQRRPQALPPRAASVQVHSV